MIRDTRSPEESASQGQSLSIVYMTTSSESLATVKGYCTAAFVNPVTQLETPPTLDI